MKPFNSWMIGNGNQESLAGRHRKGKAWRNLFVSSLVIGVLSLVVLLFSIVDQTMGWIVVEYKNQPSELSLQPLEALNQDELVGILQDNVTARRFKALNQAIPFTDRSTEDILDLITEEVLQPSVVMSYRLSMGIFNREEMLADAAERYPDAELKFHLWIKPEFLNRSMSSNPLFAGIRPALLGSLFLILITIGFAFPIGIGAAIYLEEYADQRVWFNRVIQANIENLAGVPSIVYGILGLAIFVRALGGITSGSFVGIEGGNGRTILSAGLTMGLLVLPVMIVNAREAIRAVPQSLRLASYGLGATRWQTIWHHVLPSAISGILTGTILTISRAIGETAPLIVVGAATYLTSDPTGPFSKFTALPILIYNWTTRPQEAFRNIAATAILVLLIVLLTLNAAAILLRNRLQNRI